MLVPIDQLEPTTEDLESFGAIKIFSNTSLKYR